MGIPTILIGCLPGYATIGIAAPILLALLRLVQGLAMGGEFGAWQIVVRKVFAILNVTVQQRNTLPLKPCMARPWCTGA